MFIYQPAEDSYLLEKHVLAKAFGRVLDMGTGSGIQALAALSNHDVGEVVAVDIDEEAITGLKEKIKLEKLRKIKALQSNLFEQVSGQFNTIIFNPPYLPQDKVNQQAIEDQTIYGGKKGWEISEQFFHQVTRFLAPDGQILFLFSSLTNRDKVKGIIEKNLLTFKELDKQKLPFEELFVYQITKTGLLRELEARLLEEIHYFAKGQRGIIYKAIQDRSKLVKTHFPRKKDLIKVAIKAKREDSEALNTIQNESYWLKVLNKAGIGPRYLFSGENYLVYEFVEGEFILDWIKKNSKEEIKIVLEKVLVQCRQLDQLGVNKEEMHHPTKHLLVTSDNQPILLDFERCSKTIKPKNVTQFIEFICRIKEELESRELSIDVDFLRKLAGEYKDTGNKEILKEIFPIP